MKTFSLRTLFWLSSLTWILVGTFLFSLGLRLLCNEQISSYFSLVDFFTTLFGTRQSALMLLIVTGLIIGYGKGKFVLRKTVFKQAARLRTIRRPLLLSDLYTKKYLLLIAGMMCLGFLLRALPIHPDVRGLIDLAIGTALLIGATNYVHYLGSRQ